jgi:hypothetical protein
MDYTIFDIEANGLLDEVDYIYCLSYYKSDGTRGSITNSSEIRTFLSEQVVLIGHNIKRYDIPTLLKVLGYEILNRTIDTLALSWYLYPNKKIHGLEQWGQYFGYSKVEITDWKNLSITEYVHRCEVDVEINRLMFNHFLSILLRIYNGDIDGILDYLTFKLDCGAEQEQVGLKVDLPHCHKMLQELEPIIADKMRVLESFMPKIIVFKVINKPKNMYKKDESLSSYGVKWMEKLFDLNLPADTPGPLKVTNGEKEPNSGSVAQIKNWLFLLGWKPTIFKYEKIENSRENRAIPQLNSKEGKICKGVKALYKEHPYLEHLESLFMLKHRQITFKNFIDAANVHGYMKAEVGGFTNTLRFKHKKPIANLPKVGKPYGAEIRGAIIINDDSLLFCGSDMSSLEDTTKQHYMYYYDPNYVNEMRVPGFSPHLDIGLQGGMITQEEHDFYIWYDAEKSGDTEVFETYSTKVSPKHFSMFKEEKDAEFYRIAIIRGDAKQVNFSAVYGVGAAKMTLGTGWTFEKSTEMLKVYWERNKAVKQVALDINIKVFFKKKEEGVFYTGAELTFMQKHNKESFNNIEQMWLYNPVSKFYYSLRYIKDIFSTLNQGTGVFCFDTWVNKVRRKKIQIGLQYHDEIGFSFSANGKLSIKNALLTAIAEVNQELQLNVPLGISVEFGKNYSECH